MVLAAERRRRAFFAGAGGKPGRPVGPPAALVLRGALQPLLRAVRIRVFALPSPVSALAARRVDDAGDVAAGGEHEPHVAAEQLGDTPGGVPGHDVVLFGADR